MSHANLQVNSRVALLEKFCQLSDYAKSFALDWLVVNLEDSAVEEIERALKCAEKAESERL
jgi:hypothetical protein